MASICIVGPCHPYRGGIAHHTTLLARALMAAPNLLLMDEPTTNLDRDSLSYFMETLRSLGRDGMGMLVSTHLHDQFASLTPRVLELRDGRIAVPNRDGNG